MLNFVVWGYYQNSTEARFYKNLKIILSIWKRASMLAAHAKLLIQLIWIFLPQFFLPQMSRLSAIDVSSVVFPLTDLVVIELQDPLSLI